MGRVAFTVDDRGLIADRGDYAFYMMANQSMGGTARHCFQRAARYESNTPLPIKAKEGPFQHLDV
ncbi:hypothetical protein PSA5_12585 [Pseudomonas syringae pv. actinidiae]|nr:hypothetical protein PSA5_12585 [Pseudomonas syringae pv. actinidiae]